MKTFLHSLFLRQKAAVRGGAKMKKNLSLVPNN